MSCIQEKQVRPVRLVTAAEFTETRRTRAQEQFSSYTFRLVGVPYTERKTGEKGTLAAIAVRSPEGKTYLVSGRNCCCGDATRRVAAIRRCGQDAECKHIGLAARWLEEEAEKWNHLHRDQQATAAEEETAAEERLGELACAA